MLQMLFILFLSLLVHLSCFWGYLIINLNVILASTAVSNALSWLPNRAQKRSLRAKSEGVEQLSSSPSPVETLQSLCDAETTVDGVPLFAFKCINFIEKVDIFQSFWFDDNNFRTEALKQKDFIVFQEINHK